MNRWQNYDHPNHPNHPTPLRNSRDGITSNFPPISLKLCMEVTNGGIQLRWTDGIAGPCLSHPSHPAHPPKNHLNDKLWQFWPDWACYPIPERTTVCFLNFSPLSTQSRVFSKAGRGLGVPEIRFNLNSMHLMFLYLRFYFLSRNIDILDLCFLMQYCIIIYDVVPSFRLPFNILASVRNRVFKSY